MYAPMPTKAMEAEIARRKGEDAAKVKDDPDHVDSTPKKKKGEQIPSYEILTDCLTANSVC